MHTRAAIIADPKMLAGVAYLFCVERRLLGWEGVPLRPAKEVLVQLLDWGEINANAKVIDEQFGYACYEYYRQMYVPGYFDRLLRQEAEGVETIADIGCGAGATIYSLLQDSTRREIIGIDHNGEQIQLLKTLVEERIVPGGTSLRVEVADAGQLPIMQDTYDMVICRAALQYMDMDQALSEMNRILKPRGKLFIVAHGSGYGLDYVWNRKGWLQRRTFQMLGQCISSLVNRPAKPIHKNYKASNYVTARNLKHRLSRAGFDSTCLHVDPSGQRLGRFPVYIGITGRKKGAAL